MQKYGRSTRVFISCGVLLILAEVGVRVIGLSPPLFQTNPLFEWGAGPALYRMRPGFQSADGNTSINSMGLRGEELPKSKRKDEFRVLTLGDSVAFGAGLPWDALFSTRFSQQFLAKPATSVLAAVPGYTSYNELKWLEAEINRVKPDLIVLQFCMNDVVDPWLHWKLFMGGAVSLKDIPQEAIPHLNHHRFSQLTYVLQQFRLFDLVVRSAQSFRLLFGGQLDMLTGEDPFLTLSALSNDRTPEWTWLRGIYDRILAVAKTRRTPILILSIPLAYQLDGPTPNLRPQQLLSQYARERGVNFLDATPQLKELGKENAFLLRQSGYYDVWHLTARGHEVVARGLIRAISYMPTFHNTRR